MEIAGIGINVLDIIIIAVIGITCFMAYKKGLLLTLYSIVSFFLAIWIAWAVNPIVKTGLTNYTNIEEWLNTNISQGITRSISNGLQTGAGTEADSEEAISELNLPDFVKDYLVKKATDDTEEGGLSEVITTALTNMCITIVSFVIIILIVTIVLSLLKGVLEMISEIPIFDSVNKIAGLIFGLLLAALKIWVIFLILSLFINVNAEGGVYSWIAGSTLGSWFYNNNLLSYIILKILA